MNRRIVKTVVPAAAALAAVTIAVAGCGSSSGSSGSKTADKVTPKVAGTMRVSALGQFSGDAEARRNLKVTRVWCRWNGKEIEMGASLHNGMATHVTVHIQPNYRLKKAGLHGDGIGSQTDAGVDAGATRIWTKKLGRPDNIGDTMPAITSCAPEINGVDLG